MSEDYSELSAAERVDQIHQMIRNAETEMHVAGLQILGNRAIAAGVSDKAAKNNAKAAVARDKKKCAEIRLMLPVLRAHLAELSAMIEVADPDDDDESEIEEVDNGEA